MASRYFTISKAEALELKRRSEEWDRRGWGIPHAVVQARLLARMGRELRQMVRAYDGSAREAKKLLECILIAEEDGLPDVAEIRHDLAAKLGKVGKVSDASAPPDARVLGPDVQAGGEDEDGDEDGGGDEH